MPITELGYILIGSTRTADWRRFGEQVLGMEAVERPDSLWLRMDEWSHRLAILEQDSDRLLSLGWHVAGPEELERVRSLIEAAGQAVTNGTRLACQSRGVQAFFSFDDPGGNRHEIFWGRAQAGRKFVSPAGVPGFLSGKLGLGHVVLTANGKFDEIADFWRATGLFKLTDFRDIPATSSAPAIRTHFYRCNPRHHSVAYSDASASSFGCHHFMVEVESIDEVGLAHDRAVAHQVMVASTLGRHSNDQMISAYLQTPGGFLVEFGCGAKLIDDDHEPANYHEPDVWGHEWQEAWRNRWREAQAAAQASPLST